MQEFLSKTTDDFAEDKVVNFDDDTTNNFAVLSDDVINLDENSQTNIITYADTASDIYIIDAKGIDFLKNNSEFKTEFIDIGDGIGISRKES